MPILIKDPNLALNFFDQIVNLFANILNYFNILVEGFHWPYSWGWSIIIFTIIIKFILFPTTIKQIQVMSKMKEIQPKLKEIQEKYKDRPDELQKRTMELYQKEKVNPFGGCLPMLIQLPLLWAIFSLLQNPYFIEHYIGNAIFFGLQLVHKGNLILAILSGVTTFLQQKLTTPTAGADANQQVFLYVMPIMFGFFTYQVNAGVGLYWVVSNVVQIIQQYITNEYFIVKEHIHKAGEHPKPEKK